MDRMMRGGQPMNRMAPQPAAHPGVVNQQRQGPAYGNQNAFQQRGFVTPPGQGLFGGPMPDRTMPMPTPTPMPQFQAGPTALASQPLQAGPQLQAGPMPQLQAGPGGTDPQRQMMMARMLRQRMR